MDIDANCSGLHRDDWLNILLLLINEHEDEVGGGICKNFNPSNCIDERAFGDDDIGVYIIDP